MDKFEFGKWFEYHSSAFASVGNYFTNLDEKQKNSSLDHWYRILYYCSLEHAKKATDVMFESDEQHPRRIDQHPGRVRRIATGFNKSSPIFSYPATGMSDEQISERKRRTKEVMKTLSALMDGRITKHKYAGLAVEWDDQYPGQGWGKVAIAFRDKDIIPF